MDLDGQSYEFRREEIYSPLREEGTFTWDSMYNQEYALASIHAITESFRAEIAYATEKLGEIFARTIYVVQRGSNDLLKELGIPREAWQAVRLTVASHIPTVVGRFDFAFTPHGLKMLEFNSDTPTGVVEAFYVNGKVCEYFGWENPNQEMDKQILASFQDIVSRYKQMGMKTDEVCFSSLDWHAEDSGTTRYLMQKSGLKARYVPLSALAVKGRRLYAYDEMSKGYQPVDVLYRLHAIEILAEESDDDGYPTGAHVLDLVAGKRLALINPPGAFIAQTKALQALIWNLHETNTFFTAEEHELIGTYLLPTYMENQFRGKKAYVRKPIFGREGGAVTLFDPSGNPIASDKESLYWDQMMVYQQLAELEQVEVQTLKGPFQGQLLWGSFLVGGQASAIVARVDQKITGNLSYFLPVGIPT
ncbi:glutathionylspermidine synthase family protein [Paenactinomyces guangxiensis]|uniref:Glutathionylspermidine synthase family protein n=1 Tax=Paenactinomyces guangxiensis TaxID=1490290 RepID=A0A7W1WSU7_9BACL|nr:glutathionylspermidine synthase family protein [Paenactinomyces guangxiensis]MBA4495343.1 glutathionylspermidine synthase family protein [Paenactinomyces guangxiensis]MBH8592536.1 glutathionylspermidine synthase family protein [Paenactinomyces guangxiensis]